MSDEGFDDPAVTGMGGQHQGSLAVVVTAIDVGSPPKKILDGFDIVVFECILT